MDNKGAQALAAALPHNKVTFSSFILLSLSQFYFVRQTLTTLSLSSNEITGDAIYHLATGLQKNEVTIIFSVYFLIIH